MKKSLFAPFLVGSLVVGLISCQESFIEESPLRKTSASAKEAASSTGQGIMADLNVSSVVITEEVAYTFDKDAAKAYYTTSAPYNLVITPGTGAQPATPSAPAADPIGNNVVNQDKCIFYEGGDLPDYDYTNTVNAVRGWKFTWTYDVEGAVVAPKTAWNAEVITPGVDPEIPIDVTIAGLSALSSKQHPLKYSFSLLDDLGASRVTNVKITVDGTDYFPAQSIVTGTDFLYTSNAGTFGAINLLSGTDGEAAFNILNSDSFTGNNSASNIVYTKIDQIKPVLGVGEHTITLSATVKGNNGTASTSISVNKILIISSECE